MIGNSRTVIDTAASGYADPATSQPMLLDNIFQIASMTKAITSVAAMQLVERGLLFLDDPIDSILPELANPNIVTGFGEDGKAQLTVARNAITLRHLLTHTSGLGYVFTSAGMAKALGDVMPGSIASITAPLMFEPGSDWLYGISTDWVGRAVEAASGQSLGDYMSEHILRPLSMNDTGFALQPDDAHRRVSMLSRAGDDFAPFPIELAAARGQNFSLVEAGFIYRP